jgi:acyl carrier protein
VLNQQPDSAGNERVTAQIGELIDERLRAKSFTAQLRTLSGVIAEQSLERIDLLKINVEKSELDVLQGISSGDWPKIHQLVIEVDLKQNLEPVTALLEQHGFEWVVEQDPLLKKTELCYVYAIRPSAERPGLIRQQAAGAHVRPVPAWNEEILTPPSLRHFLRERLPQYMIPPAFVLMEKFPLTSNGKIDRQALPAVAHEKAPASPDAARPQTQTEKALAAIWADLLKLDSVGLHEDFFDLGGHSLMAIRSISRIRDAFEVDVQLRNLFEHPTVAGLAAVIDGLKWLAEPRAPLDGAGPREELVL